MTLPDLPTENDDPWFEKRSAFDEAVRKAVDEDLPDSISAAQAATLETMTALGDQIRLKGSVAPEGVVAADIGTLYVNINATNGAVLWVKAGGSNGNTGWKVLYGDTGLRNVVSLVNPAFSSVVARVQRTGNSVSVYLQLGLAAGSLWTSGAAVLTLPSGFRPQFQMYLPRGYSNTYANMTMIGNSGGSLALYNAPAGMTERWSFTWATADPWPTALP